MKVEIWSDIVCPWCYINKRRFEAALAQFAHRDTLEVRWRSFELAPDAARHFHGSMDEMLAQKYGLPKSRAAAMHNQMTALAAQDGLDYHFERAQPTNTFDAHRLTHLAAAHGLQDALEERLMHAYFTEGVSLGENETLIDLYGDVGGDADEARAVLASDAYDEAVRADEQQALALGIHGVPFTVIDEQYGVSGAQPVATHLAALEQAWQASHPLIAVGGENDAGICEGDSCMVNN